MEYVLPELPYAYDALEPWIDEATMRVHHDGHHRTYVDKLNEAMKDYPDLKRPLDELMSSLHELPIDIQLDVRQNGGGHANHSFFWTLLTPKQDSEPAGNLRELIDDKWGSLECFRDQFTKIATEHFSNGWAWLCSTTKGELRLLTTKDHESPLTLGLVPLLVLDLWEHAYYLKHQNKRDAYVKDFWNVVHWKEAGNNLDSFLKSQHGEWRQTA